MINLKRSLFSLCIISLIFTSCLSDSNSKVESYDEFAYITTVNGVTCAATYHGYISSPSISLMYPGECCFLDYVIEDYMYGEINQATGVNVREKADRRGLEISNPMGESESVKRIAVAIFSSTDYFGDNWVFHFEQDAKSEKLYEANFYFDPENQFDENGEDISGENKAIIDIYFAETSEEVKASDYPNGIYQRTVADFGAFRSYFAPDFSSGQENVNGDKLVNVYIKFRFHKLGSSSSEESSVEFYGGWKSEGNENFYMTFAE